VVVAIKSACSAEQPVAAAVLGMENTLMYLRRHRRMVDDTGYEYWTLVESGRTASGPRQHTVATLGKLPGLDEQVHAGWEALDDLLEGRVPAKQLDFGSKSTPPAPPVWREVDGLRLRLPGETQKCEALTTNWNNRLANLGRGKRITKKAVMRQ
jgi:hypothetical protein